MSESSCHECEFASDASGCVGRMHLLENGGDCFSPRADDVHARPTPPVNVIAVRFAPPAPKPPPAGASNWEPSMATMSTCRTCRHIDVKESIEPCLSCRLPTGGRAA